MSGGVDSSAAAALLHEQGHEVIGVSLRLSRSDRPSAPGRCCSPDDLDDARSVAETLGIPFYVFEATELFDRTVVRPFVASYLDGETPIPCTACNREVKFGHLLAKARSLGARLATGHYARIEGEGPRRLLRGVDAARDQSYFLYDLGQDELNDLVFPVGGLTKAQTRDIARRAGLRTADKPESQDICFIPDGDTAGFVERGAAKLGRSLAPGPIVTRDGEIIGEHDGLHAYTVGQRKGLPSAALGPAGHKLPIYVSELRPASNEIVVGPAAELEKTTFRVAKAAWIAGHPPAEDETLTVRVRHRHTGSACTVRASGEGFVVHALEPIRSPAPGQSAVLYRGDEVVGGGAIERS
ncbi:tRNA-specific 2-thiouridylase MnmA [Vulgatibacter incomptus]|uniref:tRNA-specific 2-thiouridylase MnmA n=2 Tax=Vulgatibacter incomptus TaxID=1391653 RepID=A0A0K1PBN6_9BACT|nr:tRNA-specific 2-thiouridylase MnmA [Vulgatibacter incomptus]